MLTKIKESYKKILHSKDFKHKGFLCGAFLISDIENIENTPWQIDFYNKDTDTMISYTVEGEIKASEDSKVFKEENSQIEELNLEDIKVDFDNLKQELNKILKNRKEEPVKISIILQKIKVPIWNLIYITKKFNLLNIKIDATSGTVLEEKIVSLLSFEKGNK